jgi:hypothetical protein
LRVLANPPKYISPALPCNVNSSPSYFNDDSHTVVHGITRRTPATAAIFGDTAFRRSSAVFGNLTRATNLNTNSRLKIQESSCISRLYPTRSIGNTAVFSVSPLLFSLYIYAPLLSSKTADLK